MSNVMGPDTAPNRDQRFVRLVDQYQESVLRTCFLYLCDKTLAEDATQETFLKVYRTMDSFRGESSEKTWILKIAMHTCYDINHSGWFRFMNRHVTPEMLPDQSANTIIDRDEELAVAVMKLPRKLREVILLHYYQELKINEIADALKIDNEAAEKIVWLRERIHGYSNILEVLYLEDFDKRYDTEFYNSIKDYIYV